MPLNKELVIYLDKLYWIYRKVKQNQIKEECVQEVKDFWNCDIVVKHRNQTEDTLLFLRLIEDAEIVSD